MLFNSCSGIYKLVLTFMVVFVALHSKIDTAEASKATSKRFISFSHHHFPPHAPHSFWMFSCLNGFLLPPKLNLMIDDDVYTMRSRLFICDCLFLLFSNASVDISFRTRPSRSLAIEFFPLVSSYVDVWHKIECSIDWFFSWSRDERARNEELFVLLDFKTFPHD